MIIKDISEVREKLPIEATTRIDNLLPYFTRAEKKYLIPILGKTLYDKLADKVYKGQANSGDWKDLLNLCVEPLCNFGVFLAIPMLQLRVSDGGIQVAMDESFKPASERKILKLEKSLLESAFEQCEELLEFLEEKKLVFTDWASSPSYTINKKYFINTSTQFQQFYHINSSKLTYLAMVPAMAKVEEFLIRSNLGNELFEELKTAIAANNPTADHIALINLIRPAVALHTISRACRELPAQVTENGIIINVYTTKNDGDREELAAGAGELLSKSEAAYRDAEVYIRRLRDYLNENASGSKYPTYFNNTALYSDPSDTTITPVFENSTSGFYSPGNFRNNG